MADFKHLHVMTLLGVCLDGGPVPFLVLPYMSNGSLLTYLKKERHNLVIESEDEQVGTYFQEYKREGGRVLNRVYI